MASTSEAESKCPPPPLCLQSDFNTMLQAAETAMKAGGPPQRGVSVDAIHVYISRLPEVPGLARVHSAVVGWEPHNETVVTWFVDPQDLWDNWDATHVPPWLRGCNTVGRPFKTVIDELSRLNLMHIYRTQQVPALSVREIMLAHEGCRIKLLKIDTEGFDTILLVGYSDFLWAHPECHADKIQFETMHSTPAQIAGAQEALALSGYTQCGYDVDAGGGAPDSILCYSPYKDARLQWAARAQRGGGATHTEAEVWGMLAGGAEAVEAALEGSLEELQEAAERRQCGTCPWVS